VRRFFDSNPARLAIILETELWPTLYHESARHIARAGKCAHYRAP